MKLVNKYNLILINILSVVFFSCDKSDTVEPGLKDGVAVMSVEATASFDLSARKGWNLYIGTTEGIQEYNFQIEGKKLIAVSPVKNPYRFPYNASDGGAVIQLVPQNYGRTRDTNTPPLNIEDQTTPEKFMNCDRLRIDYWGTVEENLTGLTVKHFNALLVFRIDNLPPDAEVFVNQVYKQKISPLRDESDPTVYKAIVFPHNQKVGITVEYKDKTFTTTIPPPSTRMDLGHAYGLGNNALIEFTAEIIDEEELVISGYRKKMNADWPVTQ